MCATRMLLKTHKQGKSRGMRVVYNVNRSNSGTGGIKSTQRTLLAEVMRKIFNAGEMDNTKTV